MKVSPEGHALECTMYDLLFKHVKSTKTDWQSGFGDKHSNESSLQLIIENWKKVMDRGKVPVPISLISKDHLNQLIISCF